MGHYCSSFYRIHLEQSIGEGRGQALQWHAVQAVLPEILRRSPEFRWQWESVGFGVEEQGRARLMIQETPR